MAGSRSGRGKRPTPPPVIDLKAEEVADSRPAETDAASPAEAEASDAKSVETPEAIVRPETESAEAQPAKNPASMRDEPAPETGPRMDGPSPRPASFAEEPEDTRSWLPAVGYGIAALILVAVGGWLYYAFADRLFSGGDERLASLSSRIDETAGATRQQADRLAALDMELRGVREAQSQLTAAVEEIRKQDEESTAAARQSIEAADSRIADVERRLADSQSAMNTLRSAITEAGSGGASALATTELRASHEAMAARLAELEKRLASATAETEALKQATNEAAEVRQRAAGEAVALGQAVAALAAKIRESAPFATELDALARLQPALPGLETLRPHAVSGVKSIEALKQDLTQLTPALAAPAQPAEAADVGFWAGLRARLTGLVRIRRLGEPDWSALAKDAQQALGKGDLAGAIAVIESPAANLPPALARWLADARARRDAEAALGRIETASLAQLGGKS